MAEIKNARERLKKRNAKKRAEAGGGGDDGLNVPFAKERDTFIVEMEQHVETAKRDIEQLERLVTEASEMFSCGGKAPPGSPGPPSSSSGALGRKRGRGEPASTVAKKSRRRGGEGGSVPLGYAFQRIAKSFATDNEALTERGKRALFGLVKDVVGRRVETAAELARSGGRKTVSSKHASAACQLSLIGELAVHARGAMSSASAKLE